MDVLRILNDFCDDTLSGRRIAGELQRAAIVRFQKDLKRSQRADCPFCFDEQKAAIVIKFIGLLKHSTSDFKGMPFVLEPWQIFIIANIFGWINKKTGKRRFRKAHIEIARKNGKTALAAAIALILLFLDGEGRPEVYSVATEREQSKLCWEEACRFVGQNSWLNDRARIVPSRFKMHAPDSGLFGVLGADGKGSDGKNPHCCIFDEIHEFKTKGHRKLWSKMRTGSGMRKQPFFVSITTAGDHHSYLWKSERKYAAAVSRGEHFDDSIFTFICCLDENDDILDEANWPKANPGLYSIKNPTEMRDLATAATIDRESENDLKRYHCNLMVEPTAQAINIEIWRKGNKPLPNLDGRICYGGIDLGWREDLAAFWLVFPPPNRDTGDYYTLGWALCPQEGTRDLTAGDWPDWLNKGLLIATPGKNTSMAEVKRLVAAAKKKYTLKGIGIDGNNARQLGGEIEETGIPVTEHGQKGLHMNEPMRSLKAICNEGRLIHGGNPLLDWCVGNMVMVIKGGLLSPSKEDSRDKIDPAVAMIMAYSMCLFPGKAKQVGEARVRYA